MKKLFGLLVLFACMGIASAKIATPNFEPTRSEEDFDVVYYKFPSFAIYDVPEDSRLEVGVTQAFKTTFDGCEGEIRYSLFTETGENTDFLISVYEQVIVMNIAGDSPDCSSRCLFADVAVEGEFNGTSGSFYFVANPTSRFAKGYTFVRIECFYKKGQGLCVRTMLFNDLKFSGIENGAFNEDSDFAKYYDSFSFMEKNAAGKYIKPTVK